MPAPVAPVTSRLKREDCPRTKHDSLFSPWKVLVGPSDWRDHAAGKEGVQRYRIRNLPDNFPGLYELGVACASDEGVRSRRRDARGVVVVYLGQADSVRARLQQYGRSGSHLDTTNSPGSSDRDAANALAAGPGLFREVFSRGYSVVFRCALMDNKQEAEKTEALLLRVFDYAWNKLQNGACRRQEILHKLELRAANHRSLLSRVSDMKQKIFGQKAGINIKGSGPANTSPSIIKSMLPRVRTIVRFRPQLVNPNNSEGGITGIPYANRQAHRRKSKGYQVKKFDVTKRRTVPIHDSNSVCGVLLEDGFCLEHPVHGRKRCSLHKGKRVKGSPKSSPTSHPCQVGIAITEFCLTEDLDSSVPKQESEIRPKNMSTTLKEPQRQSDNLESQKVNTGEASTEDGTQEVSRDACILEEKAFFHADSESQEQQPSGRMWFELLKSQRKPASAHPSRRGLGSQITAMTDNRSCKMVSIAGMERTEKDSGVEVTAASFSRSSGWPCTCGARTSDGSRCMNMPIEGRKRCALHKGQRAAFPPTPSA